MRSFRLWFAIALCLVPAGRGAAATARKRIVLIGGVPSHGPGEHDFPAGIAALRAALASSPDLAGRIEIRSFPNGWPRDSRRLAGAATILFYCDGLAQHPLLDPRHRRVFARLMARGAGVVMLHQASTVTPGAAPLDLERWLGGARYGMVDRADETVALAPAGGEVARGVRPFAYKDEFYPTVRLRSAGVRQILTARLHAVDAASGAVRLVDAPVAWTFERPDGGRAFTFTGLHYLAGLDIPELRKLLLNAIAWSARLAVPAGGTRPAPRP